jgi:hypothetical protein
MKQSLTNNVKKSLCECKQQEKNLSQNYSFYRRCNQPLHTVHSDISANFCKNLKWPQYLEAQGKPIHEKCPKLKISCQAPFNFLE